MSHQMNRKNSPKSPLLTIITFSAFIVILFNISEYLSSIKKSRFGFSKKQQERIEKEQRKYEQKSTSNVIIGIGTGRCGTLALSVLLNSQPTAKVTHEFNRCKNFHWNDSPDQENAENRYKIYKSWLNDKISTVGDVALWSLPYVETFLKHDDVKIVALKRNRTDTLNSFKSWFGRKKHFPWTNFNNLDYFIENGGPYRHNRNGFDDCYPNFEVAELLEPQFDNDKKLIDQKHIRVYPTIVEGAGIYYDFYYKEVDKLMNRYSADFGFSVSNQEIQGL